MAELSPLPLFARLSDLCSVIRNSHLESAGTQGKEESNFHKGWGSDDLAFKAGVLVSAPQAI